MIPGAPGHTFPEPDIVVTAVIGGYVVVRADMADGDEEEESLVSRTHVCTTIDEVCNIVRTVLEYADRCDGAQSEAEKIPNHGKDPRRRG